MKRLFLLSLGFACLSASAYAQVCQPSDPVIKGSCVQIDDKIVISSPSLQMPDGNGWGTTYQIYTDQGSADSLCTVFGGTPAADYTEYDFADQGDTDRYGDLAELKSGKFDRIVSGYSYLKTVTCPLSVQPQ